MPFHSAAFAFLLVPTLLAYYAYRSERWQHFVLFASSFAFYYFAGLGDLVLLVVTVVLNFWLSSLPAQLAMRSAIAANLAVLAFFKYRLFIASFFVDVGSTVPDSIPLGISFYIFQLIAYHVDRHRGLVERESSMARFFLYVLFFPHHQAGPIMRPATFLPQFRGVKNPRIEQLSAGSRWLLWGFFLKVFADQLAQSVDRHFANAPESALDAWQGAVFFTMQIYGDFAGYSYMAFGLALLFGYVMDQNFRQPYLAVSPSEFWTRWHITLSSWLRDYLYIPLGGNRGGGARTYINLLTTMLLGGLWHGPSLNFLCWGALHGILLCVFRVFPLELHSRSTSWLVTQLAVIFLWVPFRAANFSRTLEIWSAMLFLRVPAGSGRSFAVIVLLFGVLLAGQRAEEWVLRSRMQSERALDAWVRVPATVRGVGMALVFAVTITFMLEETTFIYFRF